jgi:hypothetical protein
MNKGLSRVGMVIAVAFMLTIVIGGYVALAYLMDPW